MSGKTILLPGFFAMLLAGGDWLQFRGPNASAVSTTTGLPVEFGREKNILWRTPLPPGQSSPVIAGEHIFLTAAENGRLFTFSLQRATGRIEWRREVPRPRQGKLHKLNGPASPTPVSDGKNAYVFFYDFGLAAFGPDGDERWRLPLGPFNNPFGMAASPVLADGTLIQVCDGETGSFVVAVDMLSGKVKWRKERPGATRGFSTPLIYRPDGGPVQALVAGSYRLTSYSVESGEELWFVRGLTWQLKPTPVMDKDTIYVLGWAGGADPGQQEDVPPFEDVLKRWDKDKDGRLSKEEIGDSKIGNDWAETDLDHSGYLEKGDWDAYRSKRASQNGFSAFRLGGRGDMTEKSFLWRYTKSLPNAVSPLLYRGVLYLLKDGGILTSIDPRNGAVLKQARITGAASAYYSSPVAADGKIYTLSEDGKAAVLKAGGNWELLQVNDLEEEAYASPAILDGRIYLRTQNALYCFAGKN